MNDHALIHVPEKQSPLRRGIYGALTFIAWTAYIYLLLPLATLLLWALGIRSAYLELWLPRVHPDATMAISLSVLALLCTALPVAWGEWNRARFRKRDRRIATDDVANADVALELGLSMPTSASLRGARIAWLTLDDQADLVAVETGPRAAVARIAGP